MKIQSTPPSTLPLSTSTPSLDTDATPIGAAPSDPAATFQCAPAARKSFYGLFDTAPRGGDSRLVSPGGGTGQLSQQEAIDANSKKAGDFTEARNAGGKTLYYTPEGAHAVDAWLDQTAALKAEADPGFAQRLLGGDAFDACEQFTGKTK